jgi:ABC-type Fe3+ transport system permease subunit
VNAIMIEKELGKALLRGEDPIDVQALTQRVLRRDRSRMWLLGIACIVAWMFVVMLPWGFVLPMVEKVVEHQVVINRGAATTTAEIREESVLALESVKSCAIATFVSSIASMFVAAFCTVSFIILSRRATLRQLNARLADISAQLRTLPRDST